MALKLHLNFILQIRSQRYKCNLLYHRTQPIALNFKPHLGMTAGISKAVKRLKLIWKSLKNAWKPLADFRDVSVAWARFGSRVVRLRRQCIPPVLARVGTKRNIAGTQVLVIGWEIPNVKSRGSLIHSQWALFLKSWQLGLLDLSHRGLTDLKRPDGGLGITLKHRVKVTGLSLGKNIT